MYLSLEIEDEITIDFRKENELPQSDDIDAMRESFRTEDSSPTKPQSEEGQRRHLELSRKGRGESNVPYI
jgi:hypothetical protein